MEANLEGVVSLPLQNEYSSLFYVADFCMLMLEAHERVTVTLALVYIISLA